MLKTRRKQKAKADQAAATSKHSKLKHKLKQQTAEESYLAEMQKQQA